MHKPIKACIFDLDGVLVDTAKYHFKAWKRLAESLDVDFDEHDNEQLKGVSRADSLAYILNKGNIHVSDSKKEELMQTKNNWYLQLVATMHPDELLPNVRAFLAALKAQKILIGLGSSSKNAALILNKTGIMHFFDTVVDGRHTLHSKPHPEVFLTGAQNLHVLPSETIVFEDAISGIAAAIAGGFNVIGLGDPIVLKQANIVIPSLENFNFSQLQSLFIFE